MPRSFAGTALAVTLLALGSGPAGASPLHGGARQAGAYRPLPPVSGTLRAGRRGLYGDRSYGPVRVGSAGFASERPRREGFRRVAGRGGFGGAGAGFGAGYGVGGGFAPAVYAGQGFSPEGAGPGYGPVGYGYASGGYGGGGYNTGCRGCGGGGLGFFTQGSYGGGPRVIEIPQHVTVSYAHHGCGCGTSGLFGSFGGD